MTAEELISKYKEEIEEALTDLKTPGQRHKQIPNILTFCRLLIFLNFQDHSLIYLYCSSFPPLDLLICSKYIRSTDISAGETPEIRDACPIDIGLIASSFCLASILSPSIDK